MSCTSHTRPWVAEAFKQHEAHLCRWLAGRFPRVQAALIDEAIADTFVVICEGPERFIHVARRDGQGGLLRLLCCVARRQLRGRLRRPVASNEHLMAEPEQRGFYEVDAALQARADLQRCAEMIAPAARRFGGKSADALACALGRRFAGDSDVGAARAFGVPRDYVRRARHWIRGRVSSEAPSSTRTSP